MPCARRIFAVALFALCLPQVSFSGEAAAESAGAVTKELLLARYDVNGDQVISTEEISQKRDKAFAKMDLNQ
ncbi:MAG TPA: hypothetical protein PKD17_03210, partial [Cellvibrionaceae bacterium]|nr:hypothetical protein [Cellvibrionaceae bacterium]